MRETTSRIDRYEIEEIIGRGAMGVVYRARDPLIGRVVALKTIQVPEGASSRVREDSLERFSREARAAGLLSHPNIVTVYDVGEVSGFGASYIAMEFVEGRTLRQLIPAGERMAPEDLLEILMQVVRALDYAHRRGIVHRDVKPANILIREDGLVKLADFGVARLESSELTRTGQSVGSPSYIAPETLLDKPVDARADLFSLGVIVHEMLTGEKPFRGQTLAALYHQIISLDPPAPSRSETSVPAEWDAVVSRLLAKQPGDRYASAAHLLEDLRNLELGRPLVFAQAAPDEGATGVYALDATAVLPEPIPDSVIAEGAGEAGRYEPEPLPAQMKALLALLTVAGFALVVILVAAFIRTSLPPTGGAAPPAAAAAPRTAELTIRLAHNLKAGRLGVTMDSEPIVTQAFRGERARLRVQGAVTKKVDIPAGRHVFRVVITAEDGKSYSGVTTRELDSGAEATLFVEVKGILRRNVELTWY
ncbi:MAG TPA: serine/threonine-protein kinase [Candidatus Polarisedimenticolia bacterium]|nr:serine/threonine-protein kinase [Candidatus Polarisedimenticolia bacterium]